MVFFVSGEYTPKVMRAEGSIKLAGQAAVTLALVPRSQLMTAPVVVAWLLTQALSEVVLPRLKAMSTLPVLVVLLGLGAVKVKVPEPPLMLRAEAVVVQDDDAAPRLLR